MEEINMKWRIERCAACYQPFVNKKDGKYCSQSCYISENLNIRQKCKAGKHFYRYFDSEDQKCEHCPAKRKLPQSFKYYEILMKYAIKTRRGNSQS